jgi:flagellar biogenesis protein FliO
MHCGWPLPLYYLRPAVAVLMAALWPHTVSAQQLGQGSSGADISSWQIFSLLIFLALLVAAALALVKFRGRPLQFFRPAADRRIEIIETARMSVQSTVCLIRYDGFDYLLAITAQSVTVIDKNASKPIVDEIET